MPPKFSHPEDQEERNQRSLIFLGLLGFGFLILIGRLLYLQVSLYEENFRLSENNRMRRVVVKAERGYILDRNGTVLVRNRPSYQVTLLYHLIQEPDSILARILSIRDTSGNRFFDSAHVSFMMQRGRWMRFRPLRILEDAPIEVISIIEEHSEKLPGIYTLVESRRDYPFGTLAGHAFGNTGELDEKELEMEIYKSYALGDRIGKKGLERQYEKDFRGINGVRFVEVNAFGKETGYIPGMNHVRAVPGNNLVTTLDLDLQRVAEESFPLDIKGAVVALNPQNGEIYAMVSSPRLDPNIFSLERRELAREWAQVALDSAQPLNNRVIQGTYPPGSVFKFFTAAAGLEYRFITVESRFPKSCNGGFRFGNRFQRCWRAEGHGSTTVLDALRESCNVFFYQLGLETDMGPINEVSRRFGLGSPLGIDIAGEKAGLLVDSASFNIRNARRGWRWSRGLILNLAIGQGELVTPLQAAASFGALATNKGLYRPHLMKEIRNPDGSLARVFHPEKISSGKLRAENHQLLLQAMEEVVVGVRATGTRSRVKNVRVGGKTGSAENPHGDKTHAWFVAAAPLEDPIIVVAVLMENAGGGGAIAAPVAGRILNQFFHGTPEGIK